MNGTAEIICAGLNARRDGEKAVNSSVALQPVFKEGVMLLGKWSRQNEEHEVDGLRAERIRGRSRRLELAESIFLYTLGDRGDG